MATESADTETGRAWARAFLVICGVLAVVLAALMVASVSTGGLAGSPIEQALPGESFPENAVGGDGAEAVTGDSAGFGALNPGDETGVGGETGFDNETFGSDDTAVHFTVESSQPSYWRTGTYDRYTGSGWESTLDPRPYEEGLSHDGLTGEEVSYEVTLEQPAAALPTVWRPESVEGVDDLHVTDDGAIGVGDPLEPGTTFSGVSHLPADDTELLSSSDQSYPSDIESQYTQLPADTPDRVTAFTNELTADAENPYEKATIIEQWLRTEKDYSLEASAQSDNIADTFIFEMEAGYCEYFATAMTTMLRSQDIPTRYAVGYSTGTLVDENTYEVRGMNAHAWVEVYFEDVGWVPFEPTPASDRIDSEQAAIEEDGLDDEAEFGEENVRPGETAGPDGVESPESVEEAREQLENGEQPDPDDLPQDIDLDDIDGETDEPTPPNGDFPGNDIDPPDNGDEPPTDDPMNGEHDGTTDHGYAVTFNQTPLVPGEDVELTVTNNSEPALLKEVYFNDEPIGITDGSGTVTGTVPYAEELEIGLERIEPEEADFEPQWNDSTEGQGDIAVGAPTDASGSLLFAGTGGSVGSQTVDTEDGGTYPIETNASVTVSGDVHPGNEITVTALVNETPVSDGAVRIEGERVAETDANGQAEITVPETSGNHSLSVERDPVRGNTTLDVPELEITVEENQPLALPFGSATVTATYDNASVAGAAIERDGEHIATTGPDGTASVRFPFASGSDYAVIQHNVRAETSVDGLFRNLAIVFLLTTATVGGIGAFLFRRGIHLRAIGRFFVQLPRRLIAMSVALLVTIATRGDAYLRAGMARMHAGIGQLIGVIRGSVHPAELLAQLRAWMLHKRSRAREIFTRRSTGSDAIGSDLPPDSRTRVREAWQQFLASVSIGQKSTRTPGELATHAIERDGLPPESVITLCETFRAVEYGHRPASERLERVEEALQHIEQRKVAQQEQTGGSE